MTLRKAYQDMIKVQGIDDTATLLEMTESAMDNRVQGRKGQDFTVRQALRLQQVSNTSLFAQEIAVMSGGAFVKLPEAEAGDSDCVNEKFHRLYAHLGELSKTYSEATKDGEIDSRERVELENIGNDIHKTMQELLSITFHVFCKK